MIITATRRRLRLIKAVINRGIPLFCICRGFQELNVVLGGTLETELQKGEGRLDHRSRKVPDPDVRYGPSHTIDIRPGGMLERILGKRETTINSVHRQGVRKLAPGLEVEATAPDGIIEAVSVKGAKSFAFGTQWHPEYKAWENPDSVKLFQAYGDAVRALCAAEGRTASCNDRPGRVAARKLSLKAVKVPARRTAGVIDLTATAASTIVATAHLQVIEGYGHRTRSTAPCRSCGRRCGGLQPADRAETRPATLAALKDRRRRVSEPATCHPSGASSN